MRRRIAYLTLLGSSLIVLSLGVLEFTLFLIAPLLPNNISTALLSRYTTDPDGMYRIDYPTGYRIMRPNQTIRAFWAGNSWQHATDPWGFRNPPDSKKEIILLGDSMVYGHGVDELDTFSGILRHEYHHPVYNMGRQADCVYENYISLMLWIDEFKPRKVILFIFINDLHDTMFHMNPHRQPFLPTPSQLSSIKSQIVSLRESPPHPSLEERVEMTHMLRLINALQQRPQIAESFQLFPGLGTDNSEQIPYYVAAVARNEIFAVTGNYYRTYVSHIAKLLRERGIQLYLVDLDTRAALPRFAYAADRVSQLVRTMCLENRLLCYSARQALDACRTCFLPQDGHFSREGNRRVAVMLDKALRHELEPIVQLQAPDRAKEAAQPGKSPQVVPTGVH
ncbi:MAG: hypothetical protein MJD61_03890 [Proteobacteria bacterium]|nr:hypothetical protein [Pseudomonadota bacterium]